MERIDASTLRRDLQKVCSQVQAGRNFIVTTSGAPSVGLVRVEWWEVAEKIDEIDMMMQGLQLEKQRVCHVLIWNVIKSYGDLLAWEEMKIWFSELIMQVVRSIHMIIKSEVEKSRLWL